jgi:hypothetical protein
MLRGERVGDLEPGRDPDVGLLCDVGEECVERADAARAADDAWSTANVSSAYCSQSCAVKPGASQNFMSLLSSA